MFIKPKRKRFRRRIISYIFLLGILGIFAFFLNTFFLSRKETIISPLSKPGIDLVSVEKILKDNNIAFSAVTALDSSYSVNIPNNGQVILSGDKDINSQIASLQRILIQLTIEGKTFKNIDFRFSEPTISF
jgi:cell division septal protein FtsQ